MADQTAEAAETAGKPEKPMCKGNDCGKEAAMECPICIKQKIIGSFFCEQSCFKKNWPTHKLVHAPEEKKVYNPFPNYPFTGPTRPVYPLSPTRLVDPDIARPDYAESGTPLRQRSMKRLNPNKVDLLDAKAQNAMRKVCRLAREVLDIVAAEIKPGVTTDHLDEVCHRECMKRKSYPSPLNYNNFPKSICTSVNEVICHGIPDRRILLDGDIINLDVTLYHEGYHGDLNETYYVGERARQDADSVRVVETARECLAEAIKLVKPGTPIKEFGNVIEKHAKARGCNVVRTYVGHGINSEFHPAPTIPHYAKNKAVGVCKPGMTFTIEPMITLGKYRDMTWPDNWTSTTVDGKRTAQFEHTMLVTEDGVEILTARKDDSPGGPIAMPGEAKTEAEDKGEGAEKEEAK